MSDPIGMMGGPVSLETDTPAIVGPPVAAPAAATPAPDAPPAPPPAPTEPEEPVEDVVHDAQGRHLVPLQALQQTRAELKAAKALVAEVETLRAKAQQGEQVQGWVEQVRPLLDKLKARPDVVQAIMAGQPVPGVPATEPPKVDPDEALLPRQEAEDLARTLELYTPDGQPDVTRARKVAAVMRKSADDETARKMAPVLQSMAQGQSGTLKAQYAGIKDKAGRTVNPQVLEQLWSIVPPELVARDPQVAGVLYYAAKGYAAHHGLDEPSPPPRAPLLSEPSGGGRPAAPPLTSFDQSMRKAMQVSEKQYAETGSRFKPNAINVLED
jgi:hypothetical protein